MPNNHQNDHKQEQLDGVRVDYDDSTLTTNRGTRLSDTDNTLRAGARAHRGLRVIGVDLVPERLDRAPAAWHRGARRAGR